MVNTGIQLWTKLKIFINVCRQYFWCKTFLNKSDKYVAFTLAESLIVLGIISVLATLSTLALTNVKPDKDVIMFRKGYKTLFSAMEQIKKDTSLYHEVCGDDELSLILNHCSLTVINPSYGRPDFYRAFAKLIGAVDSNLVTNSTEIEPGIFGNEYYSDSFSTADGIYWEISDDYGLFYYKLYMYPDGKKSVNKACIYDASDCKRPNKFYFVIDQYTAKITLPISFSDSTYNPIACTYLRYPKINKFSKFPTKGEGNTCYP